MEAKLGGSPSFIWRSTVEARTIILTGSIWRIGNGKDVQILDQPWLNDMENAFVVTRSPNLVNQKVASLFETCTTNWDLDMVSDLFEERDKRCILNTMVEQSLSSDLLTWQLEDTCQFSVKSAYNMLQKQKGYWGMNGNVDFWKKLWSIRAPPKVLSFIWRVVNHSLPTKVQLQSKQVQINSICPVCNDGEESILHALV